MQWLLDCVVTQSGLLSQAAAVTTLRQPRVYTCAKYTLNSVHIQRMKAINPVANFLHLGDVNFVDTVKQIK